MEIECFPALSKDQIGKLPKDYAFTPVEGTYLLDDKHPNGVIFTYVGHCDWEHDFENCLREFILTVFHEAMYLVPGTGELYTLR